MIHFSGTVAGVGVMAHLQQCFEPMQGFGGEIHSEPPAIFAFFNARISF